MRKSREGVGEPAEYVVLAAAGGVAEGGPGRSYPTLDEALGAVADWPGPAGDGMGVTPEAVDIVCGRRGARPRAARKARSPAFWKSRASATARAARKADYQYHIGLRGGLPDGDGSESAPLASTASAVRRIREQVQRGELELRPGQRIRLVWRDVFSPTRFERRKRTREAVAKYFLMAITVGLVLPVVVILGYLLVRAWPVLGPSFILENPQNYMTAGGIWAPLVGTFFLVVISLLVSAPIGILAGVYLNEYARDNWMTRVVNLAVVNLAGVPSIVHGLFGVGAFVLFAGMGRSMLAASCTLAVMSLPVIITATREALAAVPMAFREACWNLGATRWQTVRTIVLPNSISGMLTGVIFEVTRAAGETAPILFTGAVFFFPVDDHGWRAFFPYALGDRCMALSYHLFTLATQVRGAPEEIQYGTAVVLIGLVLLVNSVSIGLRVYLRSRKKW